MTDAAEKQNPKHKKQNVTVHKELTFFFKTLPNEIPKSDKPHKKKVLHNS